MEIRIENFKTEEKLRKGYEDALQGFVFMATQENRKLVIRENEEVIICNGKDFWSNVNISVMDIEAENPLFQKCVYIEDKLILKYDNRIIIIKISK